MSRPVIYQISIAGKHFLHQNYHPGFRPWLGTLCCVFLANHFTITVTLSTQVYEWVLMNLILGGGGQPCHGLASHPGGSRKVEMYT